LEDDDDYALSLKMKERDWIEKKVQHYLHRTPAGLQKKENVIDCMRRLDDDGFDLTRAEKVQLINHAPGDPDKPVEIHLMVEECMERLPDEAQIASLQRVIQQTLPQPPPQEEEDDEEGGDDTGGDEQEDDER